MYVEVGCKINGQDAKSKKAIKEALKSDPSSVRFTSVGGMNASGSWSGDCLPTDGKILTVVGPNPFTNRKFYATIEGGRFS